MLMTVQKIELSVPKMKMMMSPVVILKKKRVKNKKIVKLSPTRLKLFHYKEVMWLCLTRVEETIPHKEEAHPL